MFFVLISLVCFWRSASRFAVRRALLMVSTYGIVLYIELCCLIAHFCNPNELYKLRVVSMAPRGAVFLLGKYNAPAPGSRDCHYVKRNMYYRSVPYEKPNIYPILQENSTNSTYVVRHRGILASYCCCELRGRLRYCCILGACR